MTSIYSRMTRRAALAIGALLPFALLGVAGISQQPAGAGQPPGQPPKPKNIKILKGLSHDKLIQTMQTWDASLGVKCDFCHVIKADHSGFDLDTKKEKVKAREMLVMTMKINKESKTVNNQVTCFLCHHGKPEPENHPGAMAK